MKKNILIITVLLSSFKAISQQNRTVDVLVGLGITAPYEEIDITGHGFYLQGEYVYEISKWVDLRPYAGVILTKAIIPTNEFLKDYKVSTNAFLFGAKGRLTIPIPWVAPYIEFGIGGSVGKFQTITPKYQIEDRGITYHIPVTLGLKLGPNHQTDFSLSYYMHHNEQQFAGAVAIGFSIPLNK